MVRTIRHWVNRNVAGLTEAPCRASFLRQSDNEDSSPVTRSKRSKFDESVTSSAVLKGSVLEDSVDSKKVSDVTMMTTKLYLLYKSVLVINLDQCINHISIHIYKSIETLSSKHFCTQLARNDMS